jgi:two-component sensor histidine kinase
VASVAVPVLSPNGSSTPAYALRLSLRRDRLARILGGQGAMPGWEGAVLDRRGHFVARTRHDAELAGHPAPPGLVAALATTESGVIEGRPMPEGVPAVTAYARSPATGYAVLVSVPEQTFRAPLFTALLRTLGAGALFTAVGLVLALLLVRRVVASLHGLQALGQGSGSGEPLPTAGLREVDDAARALAEAHQRQTLLVEELNHRVKNTLATVQSLAAQTLRSAGGDTARFTHDFGQRLQALAVAHDLLRTQSWAGADLAAVVHAALNPWLCGDKARITVEGPEGIALAPRQALAVVLALHELATNAVKYGALSHAAGRVTFRWSRGTDGEVVACWTETGGPPITSPPQRRGFGTRLLEQALARDLGPGAAVELHFAPTGLHAALRFSPGLAFGGS